MGEMFQRRSIVLARALWLLALFLNRRSICIRAARFALSLPSAVGSIGSPSSLSVGQRDGRVVWGPVQRGRRWRLSNVDALGGQPCLEYNVLPNCGPVERAKVCDYLRRSIGHQSLEKIYRSSPVGIASRREHV